MRLGDQFFRIQSETCSSYCCSSSFTFMKTDLRIMESKDLSHQCMVFVGDRYGTSNQPCVRALSCASFTSFSFLQIHSFLISMQGRGSDGSDLGFERGSDWPHQDEGWLPGTASGLGARPDARGTGVHRCVSSATVLPPFLGHSSSVWAG